jgi:hypothetical protein
MWNSQTWHRPYRLAPAVPVAVLVVALSIGAGGCGKAPSVEGSLGGQDPQPAKVVKVPGSTVPEVVLTSAAAAQIGVEETPVRAAAPVAPPSPGAAPSPSPVAMEVVPVTATIYDPEGHAWAYTIAGVRTYRRVPIVVDHVIGDTAYLSSGPPVGTPVVTQGAPELLGVEYGVGEE